MGHTGWQPLSCFFLSFLSLLGSNGTESRQRGRENEEGDLVALHRLASGGVCATDPGSYLSVQSEVCHVPAHMFILLVHYKANLLLLLLPLPLDEDVCGGCDDDGGGGAPS